MESPPRRVENLLAKKIGAISILVTMVLELDVQQVYIRVLVFTCPQTFAHVPE